MRVLQALFVLCLVGVSVASLDDLCANHSSIQVEIMVFSGTPNPIFILSGFEWQNFCALVSEVNQTLKLPTCRVLGFTGWRLCSDNNDQDCVVLRGQKNLDNALLDALPRHIPSISTVVVDHIEEEIRRLHASPEGDLKCARKEPPPPPSRASCKGPIIGPDDPLEVHFDPREDDSGCFVRKQRKNNCYDYGNDIVTNTFAQPGRGSGVCPPDTRPCVKNTCEAVKNAAISDGLTWVGTELPMALPSNGHYVSLHIWPNTNFHWIRMDADMTWSHKPGGSPVRNVDNHHKKITDPGRADFSPWTQHCGYMLIVPSRAFINEKLATRFINV